MTDQICREGAVVAADGFAAEAGADILRRGGNAFDAMVAAVLVECVVQPHNVGLGGYAGTAVLYSAKDKAVVAVDLCGLAPLASTPDMFHGLAGVCRNSIRDGGPDSPNERGYLSLVAPPIVAGLSLLLERYGTMSFADVAQHAHQLAEEGFAVYPGFTGAFARFVELASPESIRAMLPDSVVPNVGEVYKQKDLAAVIARLRKEGPGAFYSGDIPRAISSAVRKHGGILDEADFMMVVPRFEKPLSVQCGDYEVFTPQPPAGGLTALQVLKVMDQLGPGEIESAPERYHTMIEATRHAWNDRRASFGDPLFVEIPVDDLLSDRHAADTLARIRSGAKPPASVADRAAAGHTVHLVTADKDRNIVSLTATQGASLGSLVAIEGLGILMGNGMSRFDPLPGEPNSIAPGKRMQHNMSPLFVAREGRPYCATGLPGGRKIISVTAMLACAITKQRMTCTEAMDLPRFHVEGSEPAQVDSKELAAALKKECGDDYPVSSVATVGGMIAGVTIDPETDDLLAASSGGSGNIASAD